MKVKAKARDRLKDSKRNEFINKALKDAGVEIRCPQKVIIIPKLSDS